jgi:hypothetical protein
VRTALAREIERPLAEELPQRIRSWAAVRLDPPVEADS